MAADTIFFGGDILTVDARRPQAEAIAVRGERILAVGARQEVFAHRGGLTRMHNLDGKTLLPGFVHPHSHPILTGMYQGAPTLDARFFLNPDYAEVERRLRERIASANPGEYVVVFGVEYLFYKGQRELSMEDLDRLAPHNPLLVHVNNCHTIYGNRLAFERAGVDERTPDPFQGVFVRHASGKLTGKALEQANKVLLAPYWAEGGRERWRRALCTQMRLEAEGGYTTTADLGMRQDYLEYYRDYVDSDQALARIAYYDMMRPDGSTSSLPGSGDDRLRQIGVKIWSDGSPYSGNIWLSRPYRNNSVTLEVMGLPRDCAGHANFTRERFQALVEPYFKAGWQIASHSHGDRAIDMVLDTYACILERAPRRDHRLRIEHCGGMRDDQIRRAVDLEVTLSFFPGHIYYYGDALLDDLFIPEVAERWMPIGSAKRLGARFSLHNDPPMTPQDALLNIQTAVTRRTWHSARVLGEEQCIDVDSAIRAQTIDAAYQLFMDDRIGSLAPGKYADLTLLSANPRTRAPEQIGSIAVLATYVGGRKCFDRQADP